MKPRTKQLTVLAAAAVVVAVALVFRRPPPPGYAITEIGPFEHTASVEGMDDHGRVIGWSLGRDMKTFAFTWGADSGLKKLQSPDGVAGLCIPNDISNNGRVVGLLSEPASGSTAFYWDPEEGMTLIEIPGAVQSSAEAVNSKGRVAGWFKTADGRMHAFVWDKAGGARDIGGLGGKDAAARDINEKGWVVGSASLPGGGYHAFVWDGGTGMLDLGAIADANSSAVAVNDRGQVIGTFEAKGIEGGFIWERSAGIKDLELPGRKALPAAINDSGRIIGVFYTAELPFVGPRAFGFLRDTRGRVIKLESIRGLGDAYIRAIDINNRSQILAAVTTETDQSRIVILTPEATPDEKER